MMEHLLYLQYSYDRTPTVPTVQLQWNTYCTYSTVTMEHLLYLQYSYDGTPTVPTVQLW